MAKIGANQAASGQPILNWITSAWFILVTSFVKKFFVTQTADFNTLSGDERITFYDIHIRKHKKKYYVSNYLFLFNLTIEDVLLALHRRTTPFKYRLVYDDLLPNSIWKPKFFRKIENIEHDIAKYLVDYLEQAGFTTNCIGISLASNKDIVINFAKGYTFHYPNRQYKPDELEEFIGWLESTPTDSKSIIYATPNEPLSIGKFLTELPYVPDSALFSEEIFTWVSHQVGSDATYVLNHI
jgi:hypothetical protein